MANETPQQHPQQAAQPAGPGGLRSHARLTVHTRQAQALFNGRRRGEAGENGKGKGPIIGLAGFARGVAQVCEAAAADDPYADHALLQVEAALALAGQILRADIRQMTEVMRSVPPAVDIDLVQSADPLQLPLALGNAYISKGIYLLADFDELMRTLLTLQKAAILDRDQAYARLLRAGRPLRRVYGMPFSRWRNTGVTREAVRRNAVAAQQARVVYDHLGVGPLPEGVLSAAARPRFAPPIRRQAPRLADYLSEEE